MKFEFQIFPSPLPITNVITIGQLVIQGFEAAHQAVLAPATFKLDIPA
jgi:hypothetical protein